MRIYAVCRNLVKNYYNIQLEGHFFLRVRTEVYTELAAL
jgi:hypothetical protein